MNTEHKATFVNDSKHPNAVYQHQVEAKPLTVVCGYKGMTFSGKVATAHNYPIKKGQPYDQGTKERESDVDENWYVEMYHDARSDRPEGRYDYFKQHEDGVRNVAFFDANGNHVHLKD
jgi:hypothetical protein